MNPTHPQRAFFAQSVKSNFLPIFLVIMKTLIAFTLLLAISGCSTNKQTWQDWMTAHNAARPNRERQGMPPTPASTIGSNTLVLAPGYKIGDGAHAGPGFDLAMRNPDFPRTHIEAVYIDLSAPTAGVHIKWAGPMASDGPTGPWRHTPGRGGECVDCDKVENSNTVDSRCTPKGAFPVVGFADHLRLNPSCLYATWVLYTPRYIAIHSHIDLPSVPASSGCIRMPYATAKLIHNNSVVGVTIVSIYGTWQRPPNPVDLRLRRGGKAFYQ
jgi:hypothetical protein